MASSDDQHRSLAEKLKHPFPELREQLKGDITPHNPT